MTKFSILNSKCDILYTILRLRSGQAYDIPSIVSLKLYKPSHLSSSEIQKNLRETQLDTGFSMLKFCLLSPAQKVPDTHGGSLSCISVFFVIIVCFKRRLTKLLLNAVLVLFCGKSSIFQFIRALLPMRWFSMHQSLKEPPFVILPPRDCQSLLFLERCDSFRKLNGFAFINP